MKNYSRKRPQTTGETHRHWQLVALVLAAMLPYLNSCTNSFHWDDYHHIVENPALFTDSPLMDLLVDPATFSRDPGVQMYRPLLMLTFSLNRSLGGLDPFGYHLVSILLHVCCTLLLYSVYRRLVTGVGASEAAWGSALLFAVHPVNSQTVNYLSSRSVLLAAFFFLLALFLHLKARDSERPAGWLALAGLSIFLALLSKSSAITLIPLLICLELLYPRSRERAPLSRVMQLAGPLTAGAVYLILSRSVLSTSFSHLVRPLDIQWATQAKVFWHYLRLIFFPVGLNVFADIRPVRQALEFSALVSFFGILLLAGTALYLYRRQRSRGTLFFALWFFITLAPTSIMPLNVVASEHRLYLPLAGLLGILAVWLVRIPIQPHEDRSDIRGRWRPSARLTRVTLISLAVLLSLLTVFRNRVWRDELTLWSDAASKSPQAARPQVNLGLAYYRQGLMDQAAGRFRHALELEPHDIQALANLGMVALQGEGYQQARACFHKANRMAPQRVDLAINLALAELGLDRPRRAVELLERYTEAWKDQPVLFNTLGKGYLRLDQYQKAVDSFRQAEAAAPRYPRAPCNRGLALMRLGRFDEAEAALRRAVSLDPEMFEGWANLGNLHYRRGKHEQAVEAYRRAQKIRPDNAKLNSNLSLCYKALGRSETDLPNPPSREGVR